MSKNYNLIIFVAAFLFVIFLIFLNYPNEDVEPFSCTVQIEQTSISSTGSDVGVQTNASVTLFLTGRENGFFSLIGTVETDHKLYRLNRRVNFVVAPKTIHGMKMVTITSVNPHPTDNTPEDVWNLSVSPEVQGVEFYVKIRKINKNTVLINSLSLPYLICMIQEL